MDARTARIIGFGDFDLDVRAGELRKHGIRIRLQDQSFQILLMLLERPGEVVLRDEIRHKLWPNNTIVEFDHSINAAIKRLRNALGESAEEPRYIETLAKRGYRFSGQVKEETNGQPKAAHNPTPAFAMPGATPDTDDLSGQTFSNYRVLEKLGSGGMGVVYRADDLKLGRQVALKFLHLPAGELPGSVLNRFEREARAASALNHPNICTVYSVDNFAGEPVIVMELVEGETLEARLRRGALKLDRALALAIQITDALAEAHGKGVVHRDLKPANIMLTKAGAKVLDFGLAKIERRVADEEQTLTMTAAGAILGTVQYMSPEQAQGKEADARSDIFSFGLVFYEMITGKRAFEGSDPASIIAAILEREAPALEPEGLNRIVKTCLAKDPADRFQSARDLKRAIEWSSSWEGGVLVPLPPDRRVRLGWGVAALLAVGLAAVAFLYFRERPPTPPASVRFQLPVPEGATVGTLLNLSPDGQKLAFIAANRLWVHSFATGESRNLTDARGTPFWSPDSRFIAYSMDGKLKRIEATGGPVQTVTDYPGGGSGGGSWDQDGLIVFSNGDGGSLFQVPAAGGAPIRITAADPARHETQILFPQFLPDGRHFLYTRRTKDGNRSAIYVGSVDQRPEQQSLKPLVNSYWGAKYTPSTDPGIGYLLFVRDETLMAQPFDNRRLEVTGQPTPIAEQIGDGRGFSVSGNGVLVYEPRANNRQLTWYARDGKALGTVGEPGAYRSFELSPNGTRAAFNKNRQGQDSNLWLLDLIRGTSSRLVFGSASDTGPVWSPDGSRIVFSSNRDGVFNLYQQPANGARDAEPLLKSTQDKFATSWSPDGRYLLYTDHDPKTKRDIWVLPLDRGKKPLPLVVTQFNETNARFSPDGRWVAYESDESGSLEIYVRSFSMNAAGSAVDAGGKWQVSKGCGRLPSWRNDGRELYYLCDVSIMAVEIATSPEFKPGEPQRLGVRAGVDNMWGSAPDGQRFLVASTVDDKPQPYTVVLNWQSGLK